MERRPYRFIRLAEVQTLVGLRRTAIGDLIAAGEFPKPIALSDSGRAKAWLEHEITAWQEARIARGRKAA